MKKIIEKLNTSDFMKKIIKQLKKGFTLIELLAVIVILAIILIIAIPSIARIIEAAKEDVYPSQEKIMRKAAETYIILYSSEAPEEVGDIVEITIAEMILVNLIEPIIDPKDKTTECTGKVVVEKVSTTELTYTPCLICGDNYITEGFEEEPPEEYVDPVTDTTPGVLAGTGDIEDPYLVESIEDLIALGVAVAGGTTYSNDYLSLTSSIDFDYEGSYVDSTTTAYGDINGNGSVEGLLTELTTESGFSPIGSSADPFRGRINGNSNNINNLYINRNATDYVGLFGYHYYGTAENIILENCNVTGANYTGCLAGYFSPYTVENIELENVVVVGNNYTGGTIGYNKGDVTNINSSLVSVTGNDYTGGIIGYNYENLRESSISGNVTGNDHVGLAVGRDYNFSVASSIIVEGNVEGADYVGGLIGSQIYGKASGIHKGGTVTGTGSRVGRTIGYISTATIGCLATDTITVNEETKVSSSFSGLDGLDITGIDALDIYLAEIALDTYIDGDNDGNGYYWDYDGSGDIVKKEVSEYPLTFDLSGSGTTVDPYLIDDYSDLKMATLDLTKSYKLTADIDLTDKEFYMFGSYMNNFTGTFDGNEKNISNLTINSPNTPYIGFSGYNDGKIFGLNLTDVDITGGKYTAGIAGYSHDYSDISGSYVSGDVTGNDYVGLVAGYIYNFAEVNSIIVEGNVLGADYVGGIVGRVGTGATLTGINKAGTVTSTGSNVGRTNGDQYTGTIVSTLAVTSITVNGGTVGSTSTSGSNGLDVSSYAAAIDNIIIAELALDTYIGGDNDGDGYYWDYDVSENMVQKTLSESPLTFDLSGSGTAEVPYLIDDYNDLKMATLKLDQVYKLNADIDLTDKEFYMFGNYKNRFTGTFDGNAKTISNLTMNYPTLPYIGLSGYNAGTIKGLYLTDIDITGGDYTGGITGYTAGNRYILDCYVTGDVTGNNYVGLAAGRSTVGTEIKSIIVEGNIIGVSDVGGILGYTYGATLKGINKGGTILYVGSGAGRITGHTFSATINASALDTITVNGSTRTSASSSSADGLDITASDLLLEATYTDREFNFTDEALDYIWYLDSGVAKFRPGSL